MQEGGGRLVGVTSRQLVLVVVGGAVLLYLLLWRGLLTADDLLLIGLLVLSVILHEVSHGALALVFGDDTARRAGRVTLNPVRHIDPFGTVLLPGILILVGAAPFGYAKPVPVTPSRLRHPRNHGLLVSLVGPGVNIVIAVAAALFLRAVLSEDVEPVLAAIPGLGLFEYVTAGSPSVLERTAFWLGYANVVLAVFNLIPIPPLDGSAVIERVLPAKWWPGYLRLRQYSMLLLFAVVFMLPDMLGRVFDPALRLWERLVV